MFVMRDVCVILLFESLNYNMISVRRNLAVNTVEEVEYLWTTLEQHVALEGFSDEG